VLVSVYYVLLLEKLLLQVPGSFLSESAAGKLANRELNAEDGSLPQAVSVIPEAQSRKNKLISVLKVTVVIYHVSGS